MNLTDKQKELTLDMFNEDPNIINITKKVFEDQSLDGRSKEGRAVSKFLAENGLRAQTTKRPKSDDVTLVEEQVEKILNALGFLQQEYMPIAINSFKIGDEEFFLPSKGMVKENFGTYIEAEQVELNKMARVCSHMSDALNQASKLGWEFVNASHANTDDYITHFYYMKRKRSSEK